MFFFLTATGEGGWGFNGEAGPDDKVRHSGGGNKFDTAAAGDGSELGGAGEFMCKKPNMPNQGGMHSVVPYRSLYHQQKSIAHFLASYLGKRNCILSPNQRCIAYIAFDNGP